MSIHKLATLQKSDVGLEVFLALPRDAYLTCVNNGYVSAKLAAFTDTRFLVLRDCAKAAEERGRVLYCAGGVIRDHAMKLLRIQFSHRGFDAYAGRAQGQEEFCLPALYKLITLTQHGVWAFHGNLPLHLVSQDGDVLIHSEWRSCFKRRFDDI